MDATKHAQLKRLLDIYRRQTSQLKLVVAKKRRKLNEKIELTAKMESDRQLYNDQFLALHQQGDASAAEQLQFCLRRLRDSINQHQKQLDKLEKAWQDSVAEMTELQRKTDQLEKLYEKSSKQRLTEQERADNIALLDQSLSWINRTNQEGTVE